jgi:glucose/arabinose dehydrogenase
LSSTASREARDERCRHLVQLFTYHIFAYGIRNPVGLATHLTTGQLWTSVNERDALGDNLVPDYITHIEDGGFYGWPWYYLGPKQDPAP